MSSTLVDFVERALAQGIERENIARALSEAGWPRDEIAAALDTFADIYFPVPVPKPKPSISARETFTQLLLFSSLYTCVWAFTSIIFTIIDRALPEEISESAGLFEGARYDISTLIVFFPLFLVMSRLAKRDRADPTRRASKVRRWIVYLTLFIAAVSLAGDLVSLVYAVLSNDLTIRFLFKILTIAIVAGGLFTYFLRDVRKDEQE